ncbi:hypothetical protein F5Y18DRAFT_429203 [Xylariaceae sp. FL1019]|nr:hypothetical protein F5Y18DRAFT_429203 [Xylariaceae sp. FL1019]
MFAWYSSAEICFVHLADYKLPKTDGNDQNLKESRWFKRGWTLQELIAPNSVLFIDKDWNFVGTRLDLCHKLHEITSIPQSVLGRTDTPGGLTVANQLRGYSVSNKMTWAAGRDTTRKEDIAYCLLGVFDVNMPLLYGEGRKAFFRLLEKISKENADQTLLCFHRDPFYEGRFRATSPDCYATKFDIFPYHRYGDIGKHVMKFVGNTLSLEVSLCPIPHDDAKKHRSKGYIPVILDCHVRNDCDGLTCPAIWLREYEPGKLPKLPKALEPVPVPIDMTEMSRVTVEIDTTYYVFDTPGWEDEKPVHTAMRLHGIQSNSPGRYQYGISSPSVSDMMVSMPYLLQDAIALMVVVEYVLDEIITRPCMILCFFGESEDTPIVPFLYSEPDNLSPHGDRIDVLPCGLATMDQEKIRDAYYRLGYRFGIVASLRASNVQTKWGNTITLENGHSASVRIEKSKFMHCSIHNLYLKISESSG